jgi:CubicO group peptidase (beta-lactamase class C family)/flagellar hook assembly protein FlgD
MVIIKQSLKLFKMKKLLLKESLIPLFVILSFSLKSQTITPVDAYISDYMKDNKLPGLAVAIIKDGKLAWAKGYGYADIEKDIPFTPNTIMHEIASISKTVTATALFQLWEDSLFQLDDPINDYLPFPVTNPYYPDIPITFRMLVSHKSSIHSSEDDPTGVFFVPPGTAMSLENFIRSRLLPGGSLYNFETSSFINIPPGTQHIYSNTGYALLGYLIERISGMPFNEYCDQNIFQPLCMNTTSWYFNEIDTNVVARPYWETANKTKEIGLYEVLNYPCSQLKTTIIDLSKYLLMHMNYGILDGIRIIDSTTEVMMRNLEHVVLDIPGFAKLAYCMGYEYVNYYLGGVEYIGHSGSSWGVAADMHQNITHNTGALVLQNVREPITQQLFLFLDEQVTDTVSTSFQPLLNCSFAFNPCQQNSEHWKNNPDQWAMNSIPMKLGKHYYQKQKILDLLNQPENIDASRVLAKALITAKFNIAQGSELSPIVLTVNAAMAFIGNNHLPYDIPVSFSSPTGIQMLSLAATLDSYNSGNLNTTACSASPSSITKNNPVTEVDKAPIQFSLAVFPNPSTGNTALSFEIPENQKVSLQIIDMNGRLIKTIADKKFQKGEYQFGWDATKVTAGIYLVRLQTSTGIQARKLVVMK